MEGEAPLTAGLPMRFATLCHAVAGRPERGKDHARSRSL
jgi:hypothetical protein